MKPMTVSAAVLVAGAVACAGGVPPPNDQWAAAQADVGRAQSAGAPENPEAKLHLQLAQEDLQKARQLIGDDNERATTLSELARTEARLALSLAKSSLAQDAARKANLDLEKARGK
jgi:uncharacterized protein DUF4398